MQGVKLLDGSQLIFTEGMGMPRRKDISAFAEFEGHSSIGINRFLAD